VEETERIAPKDIGGPYALAISARSDIFQEFEGGPGQIAIHGTNGLSDPLGSAASHGCIRLAPSAVTWLAHHIGAGTPVTVGP
jgi:lipoprotein-anchoring transpeptidase ErfK/SrfK